jgi:hypothetical protein
MAATQPETAQSESNGTTVYSKNLRDYLAAVVFNEFEIV